MDATEVDLSGSDLDNVSSVDRPIESTDSMILILILQWTYRDSVLSSDARLHVNQIHFLARRAVC